MKWNLAATLSCTLALALVPSIAEANRASYLARFHKQPAGPGARPWHAELMALPHLRHMNALDPGPLGPRYSLGVQLARTHGALVVNGYGEARLYGTAFAGSKLVVVAPDPAFTGRGATLMVRVNGQPSHSIVDPRAFTTVELPRLPAGSRVSFAWVKGGRDFSNYGRGFGVTIR